MVRASLGCYNTESDIDVFVDMLERIVRKEYRGTYVQEKASGAYYAEGFDIPFHKFFPFFDVTGPRQTRSYSEAS
jgi:hypothetical protein